jgi:hypothetical protein
MNLLPSSFFFYQIIAYNCTEDSKYAQYWDFSALHYFFQQLATKEEFDTFFDTTLPFIIRVRALPPPSDPRGSAGLRLNHCSHPTCCVCCVSVALR